MKGCVRRRRNRSVGSVEGEAHDPIGYAIAVLQHRGPDACSSGIWDCDAGILCRRQRCAWPLRCTDPLQPLSRHRAKRSKPSRTSTTFPNVVQEIRYRELRRVLCGGHLYRSCWPSQVPKLVLSRDEIEHLIAYLKSLEPGRKAPSAPPRDVSPKRL